MNLVTLDQVNMHLRIDGHAAAPDVMIKIEQASAIVLTHIKYGSLDDDGDPVHDFSAGVPHDIQSATLLVIGELMKEREAGSDPLSQAVRDILAPYRMPSLA